MKLVDTKPEDYNYAIFHQPNGKFPLKVSKMLGFTYEQIKQGLLCPYVGNTYSGATMIGLASVLDVAKPGDRILLTSFGSGAGSDAFSFIVTDKIEDFERNPTVFEKIKDCEYVDYGMYVKLRRKIRFG